MERFACKQMLQTKRQSYAESILFAKIATKITDKLVTAADKALLPTNWHQEVVVKAMDRLYRRMISRNVVSSTLLVDKYHILSLVPVDNMCVCSELSIDLTDSELTKVVNELTS